jgi:CubicO group peptidase (beta-lactamase class C family)
MRKISRNFSKFLILVIIISLPQTAAFAQKSKIPLINDFVTAKHKYHNFNGNVLVAEKGRAIYQKSLGYADFKNKIPFAKDSIFNIASISKQFTAAIMLAVERGLLSLDESLAKYFPEISYENITVRQMLTHTSGLPEQNELMFKYWNSADPITNKNVIEFLVKYKPEAAFKPGVDFKYCNTNYSLLAMIVEKVSGQTFQTFLTKNIFEPLEMKQTGFLNPQPGNYKRFPIRRKITSPTREAKSICCPKKFPNTKTPSLCSVWSARETSIRPQRIC